MFESMELPRDEEGRIIMTKEYLRYLCEKEGQYATPKLNSQLYLNHKGFYRISCLEPYVGIEALWLQSNCIEKIEGLSTMHNLRFLYLHSNMIEKMEGLEGLTELVRLDLSDNRILKIEGLAGLAKLQDLKMENNNLTSTESIKGVLEVASSLVHFNISGNKIKLDPDLVPLLQSLPKMTSLYLKDNPLVEAIPHYRKAVIAALGQLYYLDGNMIEKFERLTAEAFVKGGKELEQETRKKLYDEKQLLAIQKKEEEREYYQKVEQRIKSSLEQYKKQYVEEYHALLKRREEVLKRIEEKKGNYNRNMLKIIKVEKDLRRMKEENAGYLEKEPEITLNYADLRVDEYIDAIKQPEDYMQIQEEMVKELEELKARNEISIGKKEVAEESTRLTIEEGNVPELEKVINLKKETPLPLIEEFKWTEEAEKELYHLATKHAFDFAQIHEDFLRNHPGANVQIEDLCKKWTEIETGKYRKPELNPMDQME